LAQNGEAAPFSMRKEGIRRAFQSLVCSSTSNTLLDISILILGISYSRWAFAALDECAAIQNQTIELDFYLLWHFNLWFYLTCAPSARMLIVQIQGPILADFSWIGCILGAGHYLNPRHGFKNKMFTLLIEWA
jgi:hypothetical protein